MIQSIESINRSLSKSRSIIASFPSLIWTPGDKPLSSAVDHFKVSSSWDGIMTAWRITRPETKVSIPREQKPRVWYCTADRLWKCQRDLVCGRGTTRRGAYHDLIQRESLA